jgi:hypothetical protein
MVPGRIGFPITPRVMHELLLDVVLLPLLLLPLTAAANRCC